jgi:hypothetical protein
MKLSVKGCEENEPEVELTLEPDQDGDIALKANGVTILWVQKSGILNRAFLNKRQLSDMGFETDISGQVETI